MASAASELLARSAVSVPLAQSPGQLLLLWGEKTSVPPQPFDPRYGQALSGVAG